VARRLKILRVFPRRTRATPNDEYATTLWQRSPFQMEIEDEVHVSCTFTWDLPKARQLVDIWREHCPIVKLGGPALDDPGGDFVPGRYMSYGNVITHRGCPNRCKFCLVPLREGKLRTLPIRDGWKIQDNNITACPRSHIRAVIDMLNHQPEPAEFTGGLEAGRIDDWFITQLGRLRRRMRQLFLAYDRPGQLPAVRKATAKLLHAGYKRRQIRCFVLIGYGNDNLAAATKRLEQAWEVGTLPFAMLYQPPDRWIEYSQEWRRLRRAWTRPAATFAIHKKMGT